LFWAFNHEGHKDHEGHKEVRPFVWPPKAACSDERRRKYKSLTAPVRFVFAPLFTAAVGALRAPTNRTASPPFVFVAPLRL
jgi:hypothetical protein